MFDIRIGTLIPGMKAPAMMPQLNSQGFESYELTFDGWRHENMDFADHAARTLEAAEGRPISALGYYGNTLMDARIREGVEKLIDNAHRYNCNMVSVFAGADPAKSVPDNIPLFREVFGELTRRAEANGVKIALENCGDGWKGGSYNIAFCSEAWELLFDAVPSDALGLEWEPCHAMRALIDPVAQLRKWVKKVIHVHGKDGTIAWDVIREHGIRGIVPYFWSRTPGFGDTNWADLFTILLQNGYEGFCDIEGYHDTVHYDDMEWSAQLTGLEYLKRCRGGVNFYDGPVEYRGYQGKRKK
ncbi:MAG: sugar phosphate isomerase/epimerase [Clostridia bacterium]|nr:sugar phosphate isomerase/epimerase [Clostridia bacterium]